ncbi:MAG TPA: tetratricopeptide repeat protein [Pyrinomonadaceae bacterium]|nr:tetratricopeptide repeat protein [Pyrinomonadaceae bacterium]
MKRFIYPLAVTLCLLLVVSQPTTVSAKDNWVSVRTKNFFMIGNAGEKEIRQVGLRLEQFREVFTRLFPNMRFNTPVPTTVVVFKSHSSYGPFKPQSNTAGYFQAGPDVNYITLTTELNGEQDPFNVIFHEYTHLLVNNTFENAPLWFNEGLAEYYSTFKITDDRKIGLGYPISNHVYLLRDSKMLPLRTLFEVDHKSPHYNESKKQGIFYAQSWALMHYLLIGKTGKAEQLTKFLELQTANVPMDKAFQDSFGVPYETMEKDLRNYVKQSRYNVLDGHFENKLQLDTNTEATPLTEAEAQAYLGDLLLHSYRQDAYKYLQKALQLDPNLGMAHASLGMAYFREGKVDQARASLERAVALNSQNYLAHYYYAFTLSRQSEDEMVSAYTPEVAQKIREHLKKAIALRPDFPESLNLLAFLSLVSGDNMPEAIDSLKKVLSVSPGRHDISLTLAQLYARTGEYKTARQMLEQLTKSAAPEDLRKHSEMLLKQIDGIEERSNTYVDQLNPTRKTNDGPPTLVNSGPESTANDSGGGSTTNPAPATSSASSDPSFYLRAVLRAPAEGETQLQATLLRLECDAKGIFFVVQTESGLLRFRAATFDDVEITTYDTSVKGEITCGERKPANLVVVVYSPNTDKRIKADGIIKSIEFVPSDFKLKPAP